MNCPVCDKADCRNDYDVACVVCARRHAARHLGGVCGFCAGRIRTDLAEIVRLHSEVGAALLSLQGGDGSVSSEKTLGIRVSALDFAAGNDIVPELECWDRAFRDHFGHATYGDASTAHTAIAGANMHALLTWVVAYLLSQLDLACQTHPAIDEFAGEVKTLAARARAASDQLLPPRWYATCPTDTDEGRCGWRIQIDPGFTLDEDITCGRCGRKWTISRLLHVISSDDESEVWLSGPDAALLFGLSERTLQRWASDKDSTVKRASGMYEVGSIRAVITGTHTQQAAG